MTSIALINSVVRWLVPISDFPGRMNEIPPWAVLAGLLSLACAWDRLKRKPTARLPFRKLLVSVLLPVTLLGLCAMALTPCDRLSTCDDGREVLLLGRVTAVRVATTGGIQRAAFILADPSGCAAVVTAGGDIPRVGSLAVVRGYRTVFRDRPVVRSRCSSLSECWRRLWARPVTRVVVEDALSSNEDDTHALD